MNLFLLFLFAAIGVMTGDVFLYYWAKNDFFINLIFGLFFNLIGIIFYAHTLKFENLGIATAIFLSMNIVAVMLAGVILFKDQLSLLQILGISMLIVAILIIELY